jgi:WD40 repeat protein
MPDASRTPPVSPSMPADAPTLPPRAPAQEAETLAPPADGAPLSALTDAPATVPSAAAPPGYEILGELGRGGMGVVYRARQAGLGRLVALKMVLAGGHAGPADLARFRVEAEAVARLQHPHIVQIHEVGEQGGLPFFSLEFCPGGSLAEQLDGTPWPPDRAAELVRKLAGAVEHAHRHGVVHRDLKPANILLDAEGEPKITDFGLAKRLDLEGGQTRTGAILGTPSYMAPEQAGGKTREVGPAADIYALGAILYELLTGRPPFRGPTPLDTVLQVVAEEPVPVRQLQPKVPRDLETICHKCLQKEPGKRYASAADLAEDLGRFLEGRPVAARPVGRAERTWRWCRRNKAVAGLLVAVAAALLVGTAVALALAFLAGQRAEQADAARQQADAEKKNAETERDHAKFQQLRAESALHAIQVNSALLAWEQHDLAEAERVLGEADSPFRQSWEQRYLVALCHRTARPLLGHTSRVNSVAVSADGTRIVSGAGSPQGELGEVKVWDVKTGKEILALAVHNGPVQSVAISADGRRVVAGGSAPNNPSGQAVWDPGGGKVLRQRATPSGSVVAPLLVWDAKTGRLLRSLKGHGAPVLSVAISADGKQAVSGSQDGTAKVWNAETGRELHTLKHNTEVVSVAVSADGQRIVTGSTQGVKVWDGRTGTAIRTLTPPGGAIISSVAVSADGKHIVSGGLQLQVWDADTGQHKRTLHGHIGTTLCVAISADGKKVVSVGAGGIRGSEVSEAIKVWDAATGQDVLTLRAPHGVATRAAISADGQRLVSGGWDRIVRVWQPEVGPTVLILESKAKAMALLGHGASVRFSADGKRIIAARTGYRLLGGNNPGEVQVWDARTGDRQLTLTAPNDLDTCVAVSPDGKSAVLGGGVRGRRGEMRLWDAQTGKEVRSYLGHRGKLTGVAFSADGQRLASGSGEMWGRAWGEVKLWDAATGREQLTFDRHAGPVSVLAFSPDGKRVVSASVDPPRSVKVWNPARGQFEVNLRLTAAGSSTVIVLDAETGQESFRLIGHTGAVSALAFRPDGTRLVSGSADKTALVWDAATGQVQLVLKGHTGPVTCVAFSTDGTRIATGSNDSTVKLWDAETGTLKLTLKGPPGAVNAVAFGPDGTRLIAECADGTMQVWEAPERP